MKTIRRHDRRGWYLLGVMFVAVFLFVFLRGASRGSEMDVDAASLANFDPGYIISDWQMGNYKSMSEAEIQAFLTSKNSCPNTSYSDYVWLKNNSVATWHFKDGHFVCLSEELFGDGEVIGSGETAAHIIWQAAQDYKINPQVIIVLLQKETSLITDPIPNNYDYRKAVGYGCPDTAPCSEKYYGLKNQIRHAAALFRTVLDGGWTNYPLGWNYVQYHPDKDCGGTMVNIRSLATSALYRYTPYQPDAGSLAAGYGTSGYCSSYGNRNFYLYFQDWFGGITKDAVEYVKLDTPRYLEVKQTTNRINPKTDEIVDEVEKGKILKFTTKVVFGDGTMCLRTEYGTENNENVCIMYADLKEVRFDFEDVEEVNTKVIMAGAKKTQLRTEKEVASYGDEMIREMVVKTEFNGKVYYVTRYDYENSKSEYGFEERYVKELPDYENLDDVQMMTVKKTTKRINPITGEYYDSISPNVVYKIASVMEIFGTKYYRTEHNTINNIEVAIAEDDLVAVDFVEFETPREMQIRVNTKRINPITGATIDTLSAGRIIKFTTKIYINGQWYYRTEHNTLNNLCMAVPASAVKEVN